MKRQNEVRYFVTDIVAIPVLRIVRKSEAYRQATGEGWGVVDTDSDGELYCDEDSSATLVNGNGQYCGIFPYEDLCRKEWFKQAECAVILQSDACGFSFWENEKGLVRFYITRDENGFIDGYRLADWTENPYDGEEPIDFDELPAVDPYSVWLSTLQSP